MFGLFKRRKKRPGTHRHMCPNPSCGYVWEHSNSCAGNLEAHRCEKCGTEQWWHYDGKQLPGTTAASRAAENKR